MSFSYTNEHKTIRLANGHYMYTANYHRFLGIHEFLIPGCHFGVFAFDAAFILVNSYLSVLI